MRISDLFRLLREYAVLGGIIAAVLCAAWLCLYVFMFRRKQKKFPLRKILPAAVFMCYLMIVAGAVFFSRSDSVYRLVHLRPLYLYSEAWHTFGTAVWRNLILNICMFVPFGILLPLLSDKLKSLWKTVGIGCAASILIECVQYITGRGQACTDDVINNTAGALIGYGLVMAWQTMRAKGRKRKVIGYLSPLFASVFVFLSIYIVYQTQEFGNLPLNMYQQDMRNVAVSCDIDISDKRETTTVYKVEPFTAKQARDFAESFFSRIGISASPDRKPSLYDNTAYYYPASGGILTIEYQTRTYRYWDRITETGDGGLSETEVRRMASDFGVDAPVNAEFVNDGGGQYRFVADNADSEQWQTGQMRIRIDGTIKEIEDTIVLYETVAEREIISQKEAYGRIEEGRFPYWAYSKDLQSVEVVSVTLEYLLDSKGFYRPVYVFGSLINGREAPIMIPAF